MATVESILLYGSETWTITKNMSNRIDGCYTNMLRKALNIDNIWYKINNILVYGSLPKVTTKIERRGVRLAGHIARHADLTAHQTLFGEARHGQRGRGRHVEEGHWNRELGGDRECDARPGKILGFLQIPTYLPDIIFSTRHIKYNQQIR